MNVRNTERQPATEQTSIAEAIAARPAASPLWNRAEATAAVTSGWLQAHPEFHVTENDLSKFVQQLLTELMQTGRQRRGGRPDAHAQSLLAQCGIADFGAARTATIRGDIPRDEALAFGRLAELLAPLAAAIQLARTPVADAAADLLARHHPTSGLTRRELRGFVVKQVRPFAQQLHARVGAGLTTEAYLELILADVDQLAAATVAAALGKQARPATMTPDASARLHAFAVAQLPELRQAARRYGSDADDIVGRTMLKLVAALRNDPGRDLDARYVRTALANTAIDVKHEMGQRAQREVTDTEDADRGDVMRDDTLTVDAADGVLHLVFDAADALADSDASTERSLARLTLLRYFLAEPEVADPRRARLAAHVLALSAPGGPGRDEVSVGLEAVATTLAPSAAAARRVCRLALTTLRGAQVA